MAQQDINSATVATTITGSDSVFISKNDNAIQKIDYDLLAKAIIEQYAGSTLGGHAQALKTAIDALNNVTTSSISSIFTPASGFALVNTGIVQYKFGRMVSLEFSVKKTDETVFSLNRSTLGTLVTDWSPQIQRIFVSSGNKAINNLLNTINGNIMIMSNGQISVDIINTETKEVHISCTYIARQ